MNEKNLGGRPPYVPNDKDRATVENMARTCTHDQIARVVGISDDTLRKYYRRELDTAKDKVDAAVGQFPSGRWSRSGLDKGESNFDDLLRQDAHGLEGAGAGAKAWWRGYGSVDNGEHDAAAGCRGLCGYITWGEDQT